MRFLGNKTRLLNQIQDVVDRNQISGSVFCDLFAGSGAVGDFFKNQFSIISNDYLYSTSIINKAKLCNKKLEFSDFVTQYNCDPFEYFNSREYVEDSQYFITNNYSPKGNRLFFSEENARKIDGIRIELEELYRNGVFSEEERVFLLASLLESVMGVSNTTGTYEAFLKKWDKRALKSFELKPLEIAGGETKLSHIVYNKDSNALLREISGDVLYIDPPYTITDYNSAYHLLESIAKYDYPTVAGITGRRQELHSKSKYTKKEFALINFEDLFRQAQFTHILVSYSTQGLVSITELCDLAKKFAKNGEVKIYYFPYREYRNIRSSKKGDNLCEVIIYFQKNFEIIKSPLNYTGSKYSIMNEITKILPKHISTFCDMLGGAFNVGCNVFAEQVVYNEYLPHTFSLIELLLKNKPDIIINKIENIIREFNLQKSDKEAYLALRKEYNTDKDIYKLFVLHMFCFQNQMRFNSKLEFNTPVGNSAYNETLKERIFKFIPKTEQIIMKNKSYEQINFMEYDKDTVFYFDPPYFITSATYNDGKRGFVGWNADEETKLLKYITLLHEYGYKFILSNVICHRALKNNLLLEWINTHCFYVKTIDNVGSKNIRNEVIVTNFRWEES